MSGFVGAVLEAWDELRLHRLRVLLALVGVAVAVTAITTVTAAIALLSQGYKEMNERSMGRPVTLTVWAGARSEQAATPAELEEVYATTLERYGIEWATRHEYLILPVRTPDGTTAVEVQSVDPDFGTMMRVPVTEGRWFTDADTETFAPLLVVNEKFLDAHGMTGLAGRPTVLLGGATPVRAAVVGVVPGRGQWDQPMAYALRDQLTRWDLVSQDSGGWPSAPELRVWVPESIVDELGPRLQRDVAAVAPGWDVNVHDNRMGGLGLLDGATRWAALGIGGLALLLGGLGLVNIALVTVRHRIREIGIRRSFGATSGRVFLGVLMESVVAAPGARRRWPVSPASSSRSPSSRACR